MAITKDITVQQGANHVEEFTIEVLTHADLPFNSTTNPYIPLDLTVATIQMQVRQSYTTSSVLLTATDLNGKIVKTDASAGTFEVRIAADDLDLAKGSGPVVTYLYDLLITLSPSNTIKVAYGDFKVVRSITRI